MNHSLSVRIYYEDTDAAGVVYYANYLKYLERGREELLRALGLELVQLQDERDLIFPVRDVNVRYRAPARLGDLICVRTHRIETGRSAITFHADIVRDETKLVTSVTTCASVNRAGRLVRIPPDIAALLSASAQK